MEREKGQANATGNMLTREWREERVENALVANTSNLVHFLAIPHAPSFLDLHL
jgi:hypothetical protein